MKTKKYYLEKINNLIEQKKREIIFIMFIILMIGLAISLYNWFKMDREQDRTEDYPNISETFDSAFSGPVNNSGNIFAAFDSLRYYKNLKADIEDLLHKDTLTAEDINKMELVDNQLKKLGNYEKDKIQ